MNTYTLTEKGQKVVWQSRIDRLEKEMAQDYKCLRTWYRDDGIIQSENEDYVTQMENDLAAKRKEHTELLAKLYGFKSQVG